MRGVGAKDPHFAALLRAPSLGSILGFVTHAELFGLAAGIDGQARLLPGRTALQDRCRAARVMTTIRSEPGKP
jgi:hypothetical protein